MEKENETDKFTQEVRLAATGTLLDWSIGGFYTDEQSDQFQTLNASMPDGAVFPVDLLTVNLPSSYQEYAGFGTLTWHLTQQLDFTGGVRYAHNSQRFEQIGSGPLIFSVPERSETDSIVTYLATIRYRASENLMSYVRYATGYRPGGPNVVLNDLSGQPLADPTFGADKLRSYEGGIKASSADRRFGVDAAVYFIKWDDLQINAVRNGLGVVDNAAAAQSKGAELTADARADPQLTLVGALGYVDAELSEDAPDLGGFEGDRLPDTPEFTGTLSADYGFEVGGREAFLGTTRAARDRSRLELRRERGQPAVRPAGVHDCRSAYRAAARLGAPAALCEECVRRARQAVGDDGVLGARRSGLGEPGAAADDRVQRDHAILTEGIRTVRQSYWPLVTAGEPVAPARLQSGVRKLEENPPCPRPLSP